MQKLVRQFGFYLVWVIALSSLFGSLYFSEVLGFAPCVLCWYQRIAMYPLVLIIPVGILLKDTKLYYYVLPLSIAGMLIGLYQNLLGWGIIREVIAPCAFGVSCTTKYINYFGFITIPFLSLCAFTSITIIMLILRNFKNDSRS